MVRQYIGARYVPKFFENPNNTAEWLPNVIYEPLTIVTYGLNSYTSKKTVPASVGDPSNNPDYWVATGNYNAMIAELNEKVSDIEDDITTLDGKVSNIEGDITTLDGKVSNIEGDITTLDGKVEVLEKTAADKKYIFIADSYGNYNNASDRNMIAEACNQLGITQYEDIHTGSTGFGTTPTNFATMLNGATSTECDVIVVIGMANDLVSSISNISNGFSAFNTVKNTKYPNAKVIVLALSTSFVSSEFATNKETIAEYGYECSQYGYDFINAINTLSFNTQFRSDLVHPNSSSVDKLANTIKCAILYGKAINGEAFTDIITAGSYFTNGSVNHGSLVLTSNPEGVTIRSTSSETDYENAIDIRGDSRSVTSSLPNLFRTNHTNIRSGANGKYGYKYPVLCLLRGSNVFRPGYLYVSNLTETYAEWGLFLTNDASVSGVTGIIIYL